MDIRDAFFGEIYRLAQEDKRVVVLTADMGAWGLEPIKKLTGQFYNVGVCEQTMIDIAVGLSLCKRNVFAFTIASFLIYRAFEQIKLMVDMNLPVTLVGAGSGTSYGMDGASHHCLYDEQIMDMLGVPTVTLNERNAEGMAEVSYYCEHPLYIRMVK